MTGLSARIARLEPDERDAVQGDLAELGVTGMRALRDLLGLIVRRQALAWTDRRPWLPLGVLVVPLVMPPSLAEKLQRQRLYLLRE